MDTNETPETNESTELNFGTEIAKALVISTVTSIGAMAGFVVVGVAVSKFQDYKDKREAKKAAKLETTED